MIDAIHKGYEDKISTQSQQIIEEQVQRIKETMDTNNSGMLTQVQNMESLIARIDHERRAYRDRNEFLEEENSRREKDL